MKKVFDVNEIYFKDYDKLNSNLDSIIKHKLGAGIFVSDAKKFNTNKTDMILGIYIPRMIDDQKTNKRKLKFLRFDSIGILEVEKESEQFKITLPSLKELDERVSNKMSKLVYNVEATLLQNTYKKLVKIPVIQNSLNPIKEIFVELEDKGEIDLLSLQNERGEAKVARYISFLESLEFVRIEKDKITSGNKFTLLEAEIKKKNDESFHNVLLADTLKNGLGYLKEYLNLTSLTPYLKWSTSYYLRSSENKGLLNLNMENLIKNYMVVYRNKPPVRKARNQLDNLVNVGILEKEGNLYSGMQDIFEGILPVTNKVI